MTNAEAAYILDNLAWLGPRDQQDKVEAAIRIAVEELRYGGEKGMSDLISRQAAIDTLEKLSANYTGVGKRDWHPYVRECQYEIQRMPSAQERKKGKWIPHEDEDGEHYGDKCSECGEWYVMPYGKTNYCPNCGADMRGKEE